MGLLTYLRRQFNKPGQRFCKGDVVTHKELGQKATVLNCESYELVGKNLWEYKVFYSGKYASVIDYWRDNEIQ